MSSPSPPAVPVAGALLSLELLSFVVSFLHDVHAGRAEASLLCCGVDNGAPPPGPSGGVAPPPPQARHGHGRRLWAGAGAAGASDGPPARLACLCASSGVPARHGRTGRRLDGAAAAVLELGAPHAADAALCAAPSAAAGAGGGGRRVGHRAVRSPPQSAAADPEKPARSQS